MKKSIIMVMLGMVLLFSFTGCSKKEESIEVTDAFKFKEEYELLNDTVNESNGKKYRTLEIDENNSIVYKTVDEIVDMMEDDETFVVYFGFASCPWCRSIIKPLLEVGDDLEISSIYYVDVKEVRDVMELDDDGNVVTKKEGTDAYYKLLEKMDSVLDEYILMDEDGNEVSTNEKRIYAPNIVSVIEGEAVELTDGISDKQTDGYMELIDEIEEESYEKIKCSIKCVVDAKEVCSAKTKC